jgi:RNA polymerase sigma factor (sigma-70 family)
VTSNLSVTAFRSIRTLFTAGTVGGLTDKELLERFTARDGDGAELAFASLVERHGPMVLRVCRAVLRDAHEAEDAFQATFLILALKAGSIRARDSLTSWLYCVAYNVASTARSSAARRRSHELKAGQARSFAIIEDRQDDLRPVIHEELDRIPERYRAVLVLCCLEGLTQHQAAQQLGWPLGTVQSRLARGRERLRVRLTRRGVTPATAVSVLPLSSEAAQAAMSAALANSTVRLALTIGAARALAIGTVPAAVMKLAKGAIRTMIVNKVLTTGVAALLAAVVIVTGAAVYAYQAAKPDPAIARPVEEPKQERPAGANSDDGLLTVTGIVRMRDGSPVVGATVRSITGSHESSTVARTDDAGRFQLRAVFGNGCRLHASSADGSYQSVRNVQSVATRTALTAPLELTVLPALHHEVTVLSDGRPVAGAHVGASGTDFRVQGITGQDGKVRLRLPAKEPLTELVAWHPTLGANGKRDMENRPREGTTTLSLLPPAPLTIHVVDVDGKPVGGLELDVSVRTDDSDWIVAKCIDASHARTSADGTAIVPWAPREKLRYVDVGLLSSDWKRDDTDLTRIKAGMITIHARRERTVQGRLIMPDGADAESILVSGFGFGPANNGDIPYARARRDSTFRLRVFSEHAYVLGVEDLKWASDPWSGMILPNDSAGAAEITLKVYPATPLTVKVTRGRGREPVVNAWVNLATMADVNWTDSAGKKQLGTGGVRSWLTTDADGVARAGVGKGKQRLRLSSGDWDEEREVQVTSDKPVEVEFHRSWNGKQRVTGRLMFDGAPYTPSPTFVARAWGPQLSRLLPPTFEPVVHPDGSFKVAFDAETVSLLFVDRNQERSGFTEAVRGDSEIKLTMEPTATYSGTLVDDNAQPVAGCTLEMYVKGSGNKSVAAEQTDKTGQFQFTGVPSNVPLQFGNRHEVGGPECYIVNGDRLFKPDEVREHDQLKLHRVDSPAPNVPAAIPLAKSVESNCRNARACGMRALVGLLGDDSGDTARMIDQLFAYDEERARAVLSYVTVRVDLAQLKRETAAVTSYGWPRPAPGEIVLVALDGDQKTIAARRIATKDVAIAVGAGIDFLQQNRPRTRNALTLLAEARSEAKRSGRRVWVIQGGPRCGPCFRLARWIEDHHATLDKDYVIVKLMDGIDEHVTEAIAGLPVKDGDGIPWFAITEPDGTVLAISRGPLGNIGFPASVEEIRHFRRMLDQTVQKITAEEVDRLIASL